MTISAAEAKLLGLPVVVKAERKPRTGAEFPKVMPSKPLFSIKLKPLRGETNPDVEFTGKCDVTYNVTYTAATFKGNDKRPVSQLVAWAKANGYSLKKHGKYNVIVARKIAKK